MQATKIDQEKREELLTKIAALLQKTLDNGCTEGEALAASGKASELMAKYGLSLSDLKAASPTDVCGQDEITFGARKTSHEVRFTCVAISEFTGTKVWTELSETPIRIKFFGLPNDVSIAVYLFKTFQAAMDYEWQHYWSTQGGFHHENVRTVRKNFMVGMARRLNERLRQEAARAKQSDNNCRAIVVVKEALVAEAFNETFNFRLRTRTSKRSIRSERAFSAGQAAGSRVSFNKHLEAK
jgi:predicted HicB family RNase H-like nuclease